MRIELAHHSRTLFKPAGAPHAQQSTCTYEDGILGFFEINRFVAKSDIKIDPVAMSAYARYNTSSWVGFDNSETHRLKMCYSRYKKLGGVFSWDGEMDDQLELTYASYSEYTNPNCDGFKAPSCDA